MEPKALAWTIIVAILSCIATLIAKDVYESVKNKSPHKKVDNLEDKVDSLASMMEIMKVAQRNALWLSLTRTYNECMSREYCSEFEKAAIAESFESYDALGGNHGMSDRINEIMKLPLKPLSK